jgi:hypothetical protein
MYHLELTPKSYEFLLCVLFCLFEDCRISSSCNICNVWDFINRTWDSLLDFWRRVSPFLPMNSLHFTVYRGCTQLISISSLFVFIHFFFFCELYNFWNEPYLEIVLLNCYHVLPCVYTIFIQSNYERELGFFTLANSWRVPVTVSINHHIYPQSLSH